MSLTRQEINEEYFKCLCSPTYAIETFLETFDKTQEGFVSFKLFPRQKEIINAYEKHRFNLVTKPRQAGVSTTTAAYMAIKVGFADYDNPENILIVANKQDLAFEFLAKIKDFLTQLPRWVWGDEYYGTPEKEAKDIFLTNSKKEIRLPNKCRVKAVATSKDALRGFTPTYLIMDEAAYIENGAVLFGAALTALGCLTKDSLILTENGLVEMNELVYDKDNIGFTDLITPHKVCNMDGNIVNATQTFVSEYGQTFKIKTKLGIELEGSWKHPILINRGDQDVWVRMNELVVGDTPIIQYGQNYFGSDSNILIEYEKHNNCKLINIPKKLEDNIDFVYLLGLFLAGGNFFNGGIRITNIDESICDFLINDKANLGVSFKQVDDRHFMLSSTELVNWFNEVGLKKYNASDKEIPLALLKMPKIVIKAFLQGMFDGDGVSTIKGIKYASTSKKLIKTLQILLLNFGIISHIKYEEQKTNKKHIRKIYNLKIYDKNAIKFYDEIGFRLKRKQNKKEFLLSLKTQILENETRYIDVIDTITESEDYTYDLHVPITNSFISNGVISHNTGGKCMLISCVTDDTFIFTDKGLKQLSDLIDYTQPNNPEIGYYTENYSVRGNQKNRESNILVNNGLQKTIKLTTTNGDLEGTFKHKLWGFSNASKTYDWFELGDLSIGDYVNIQHSFNIFGNNDLIDFKYEFNNKEHKPKIIYDKITTDLAYLIGLYISEGSCYEPINENNIIVGCDITITCGDDISSAIEMAGFNFSSYDNLHYTISSKYFGSLLEHLGFDLSLKAPKKYIPNRLLELGKENMVAMLQGIMDGNGYSDKVKGIIGINLSSKKLCQQIRFLLLNFGILTDYVEGITKPTKIVKVSSDNYRISATSIDAKKYYDVIGFRFERKQIKQEALTNVNLSNRFIIIPNGKVILREIINVFKLVKSLSNTGLSLNDIRVDKRNKTANISTDKFTKFIDYFINVLKLDLTKYNIDKILLDNSKWVPILSLVEGENNTYDFSLPETDDFWCHSVIYNGILGHQTPNGMDPLYYKTYDQSKQKKNSFNVVEMKWYEDLRYNKGLRWLKKDGETELEISEVEFTFESYNRMVSDGFKPTSYWYEEMCRGMNNDAKMIAQELDVSFIGSGGNVISEEYIEFQNKFNVREPKYTAGGEGEIWIWEEPIEGHQYILSSDVARGDGEDSSTITIINFTTMEQVMEYKGMIAPDLLAQIIEEYGNLYKAYTVVDITGGMGVSTVLKLLEFGYKRLHYESPNGRILSSKQKEMVAFNKGDKTPGFQATNVRLPMIANLEYQIRTNGIKIRSNRLTSEMLTFVYKKGRPDHMDGYHDDCLKKGTLIKTIDGYKPIENINVGDMVMTHKGRYREVEALIEKIFDGDWYDMNFQGQLSLGLSYNHPLYSAPNSLKRFNDDKLNERDWVLPSNWGMSKTGDKLYSNGHKPRQISIKETLGNNINKVLSDDDYYIKSKCENSNKLSEIILDTDFSKFLGLFLADGHSVKNSTRIGNNSYLISIAFHTKDEELCLDIERYLNKLEIGHNRSKVKGKGFSLLTSSKLLWYILNDCYNDDREKILPIYSKYLGDDLKYVLEYWLKGDGWQDTRGNYDSIGVSTSKILALSMRDIAWSIGKYAVINKNTRHRYGVKTKDQYWVHIREDIRSGDRLKQLSDFEYGTKTVSIEKSNFCGIVYNLQVAEDESFIANGIVVHNCIMAMGMGLWVLEHSFKNLERMEKQTKAILNSWVGSSSTSPTIKVINEKGNVETKINEKHIAYKNVQDPRGEFNWLFGGKR